MDTSVSLTCPEKLRGMLNGLRSCSQPLDSMTWMDLAYRTWVFPPSSIHHILIPPTSNLLMIRALEGCLWCPICWDTAREECSWHMCPCLFIIDAFQRAGGGRRERGGRAFLQDQLQVLLSHSHVGTGPKHGRRSGCGKAWAFYQQASSKGQIRDSKFLKRNK